MRPSEALELHRNGIRSVVEKNRAKNARVTGSVLRGADSESSELDLLVDPTEYTTLFDIGAIPSEPRAVLSEAVQV